MPMIACPCEVCRSHDPRDKRLRTSALVQVDGTAVGDGTGKPINILIDAGPDFRAQMLREGVDHLDAILLTHEHKDHDGGLDDVRALNYFSGKPIDVWATERVQEAIRHDYAYAFGPNPYPGAPQLILHTISDGIFDVRGVRVMPIHGMHNTLPVTGFRFFGTARSAGGSTGGDLAYLTDFNHIEDSEVDKLKGVKVLTINALAHNPHPTHFNLTQALEIAARVGAEQTYLTHVSHKMGFYAEQEPRLPAGVHLAYDGLEVEA